MKTAKTKTKKYDLRTVSGNLAKLYDMGFYYSTLESIGKRGKITKYWMMYNSKNERVFMYSLSDIKNFIKAEESAIAAKAA